MKTRLIYIFAAILVFNQIINTSYAVTPVATAVADKAAGAKQAEGLTKFLDSPAGTIVLAGIATVFSAKLYSAASDQEEESQKNIKKIEKIIASFKDSYAGFCPNGREDLKDARCYCYTDAGKENTNRSNSQTCKDLWAQNNYKLNGSVTDYNAIAYNPDVAGCVAVTGQFDQNCQCKKLVDAKGNNACKKEATISMPADAFSTGLASSTGVKDLANFVANSTNGNPRFDLMNGGNLATKAVNARKFRDQMISKLLASDKNANIPMVNEGNIDKYAKAVFGEKAYNNALASNSNSSPMNVSSARSDNPAVNEFLKQAQAKVGLDVDGSGKGLGAKKEKKKNNFDFNFSGDSPSASAGQVVSDFPEKNYKYKNSDIVTDNNASIFEIISNRYVQSGLKRLFEDEPVPSN